MYLGLVHGSDHCRTRTWPFWTKPMVWSKVWHNQWNEPIVQFRVLQNPLKNQTEPNLTIPNGEYIVTVVSRCRLNWVRICFHKSNLPVLPSLSSKACLISTQLGMAKILPSWATAACSCDLWLTVRDIRRYMLHIPSLTQLGFCLSFFGFLSFINSYLYEFITHHV